MSPLYAPARWQRILGAVAGSRSLRSRFAALLPSTELLVLFVCFACGSDTHGRPAVHAANSAEVTPASTASADGLLDRWSALQCYADCPAQSVIENDANCPSILDGAALDSGRARPTKPVEQPLPLMSQEFGVESRRTPISGETAAKALERAFRSLVGRRPSRETVAILTAHWAHETNQGASMYNYNFGGIKGVGPSGGYAVHGTSEGAGIRTRRRTLRFRAYADAKEGALDYLSLLRRLYAPALEAAARGEVAGFVRGLKQGGYFTADEELYLRKVSDFVDRSEKWGFNALGPSGISPRHRPSREKAGLPVKPRPPAPAG